MIEKATKLKKGVGPDYSQPENRDDGEKIHRQGAALSLLRIEKERSPHRSLPVYEDALGLDRGLCQNSSSAYSPADYLDRSSIIAGLQKWT